MECGAIFPVLADFHATTLDDGTIDLHWTDRTDWTKPQRNTWSALFNFNSDPEVKVTSSIFYPDGQHVSFDFSDFENRNPELVRLMTYFKS